MTSNLTHQEHDRLKKDLSDANMIYEDLIRDVDKEFELKNNVTKLKDVTMLDLNKNILYVEHEKASEIAKIRRLYSKDADMMIKCREESREHKKK